MCMYKVPTHVLSEGPQTLYYLNQIPKLTYRFPPHPDLHHSSRAALHSSKREPLGTGYQRGHIIPQGMGSAKPFGMIYDALVSALHTL